MIRKFTVCTHPPPNTLPLHHADSQGLVPEVFILPASHYLNVSLPSSPALFSPLKTSWLFRPQGTLSFLKSTNQDWLIPQLACVSNHLTGDLSMTAMVKMYTWQKYIGKRSVHTVEKALWSLRLESYPFRFQSVCPWVNYLRSLNLSFSQL